MIKRVLTFLLDLLGAKKLAPGKVLHKPTIKPVSVPNNVPKPAPAPAGRKLNRLGKAGVFVAVLSGSLITSEGIRYVSYPDPATKGAPYTACVGSTKNVKPNQKFTKAECDERLYDDIVTHNTAMNRCMSPRKLEDAPEPTHQAVLEFGFNVGAGNYCRSTMRKRMQEGKYAEACYELIKKNTRGPRKGKGQWSFAAGKYMKGLDTRRHREYDTCMKGVQ